jgi:hypothetical protein
MHNTAIGNLERKDYLRDPTLLLIILNKSTVSTLF